MPWYRWDFAGNKDSELAFEDWLHDDQSKIDCFSFGGVNADIIALFDDGDWSWTKVPKLLDNKLRGRQKTLPRPTYVCTGVEQYYIHFADGKCEWVGPRSFSKAIDNNNSAVSKVAFAPHDGWYVLFEDGSSAWDGLPKGLHTVLKRRKKAMSMVRDISVSAEGFWFVIFEDGDWRAKPSPQCRRAIDSIASSGGSSKIELVWLGGKGAFCIRYDYYGKLVHLSPWNISYSSNTIPAHFAQGMSVWKMISDLEKKLLNPDTFPPIRVVKDGNRWISLDNRRLFVFQNAAMQTIPTIMMDNNNSKQSKSFRSVKVSACNCKECSYGPNPKECSGSRGEIMKYNWSRSWTWLLFLKSTPPPRVLLLADSACLKSPHSRSWPVV